MRLVGVEDEHKGSGARIYDRNVVKLKIKPHLRWCERKKRWCERKKNRTQTCV